MTALRIAVAGTGFIGRVHARSARAAGATLAGVAASSPTSAERAAAELGAAEAFASAEDLAEADGVDVVHICTPNHLHEPLALKALSAGKHVVLEKPVALDGAGATRIAEAAAAAARVVAVPFAYRFHPMVREARARVAAGELGRVRLVHGTYLQDWLLTPDDTNWRVDAAQGGPSRAFADIGSHWCDLVEFVSGCRISRVLASTATTVASRPAGERRSFSPATGRPGAGPSPADRVPVTTEDVAVVLLETDGGAPGSVVVSQVSAGRKNRLWFEVDGEHASVTFDQEAPETLLLGHREGTTALARDAALLAPDAARLSHLPAGHAQGYQDCFDLFVADAYAAMAGVAPDGLPLVADGVRAARITDAVMASARTRAWTDVVA
ncbi:MAG TPA: Gfo/Idh/MocA family oxidoreductase [Acidimicrobiales bacterium]|jgi:predicted dehydrogenase|nr:Gfo/Idh/MocA family oxidoreductase [Acidimicrobiales bacterium]